MRQLDGITDSKDMSFSKPRETVEVTGAWCVCCGPWVWKELDMTQQLNNYHFVSIFACELTKDFLMFIFIGLFIYLATLGLSCGMWDLVP